jgi:outer membrane protein
MRFDRQKAFLVFLWIGLHGVLLPSAYSQSKRWSLKQCIDTAIRNNLSLQQSAVQVSLNKMTRDQSKANLLPTITGSANQNFNTGRSLNPVSNLFTTGNIRTNNFSVTGSLVLFNGFQNQNTVRQNQVFFEASKYDVESAKNDIIINVINAYLQVVYANEQIKNAQNQVLASQAQLDQTSHFVEVGKKAEGDLLQIKSQLATDKLTLVNAKGQLKTAKLTLQQYMVIPLSDSFDVELISNMEPQLAQLEPNANEVYEKALAWQPSIKSYRLKRLSAEYALKVAKGSYSPRLTMSGSFTTNYSSASKLSQVLYTSSTQPIGYLMSDPSQVVVSDVTQPSTSSIDYPFQDQFKNNIFRSISFTLFVPIFNNFQSRINVQRQKINIENAVINEEISQVTLRKNVELAYVDAENALGKRDATKEQLDASQRSYENAQTLFEVGKMTTADLLLQKSNFTNAQSQYLQAKYDLIFRLKLLDYYRGIPLNLE